MSNNRSVYGAGILATLLALTGAGLAARVAAQDLVKAKFTLSSETRFGTTVLPAGQYTLTCSSNRSARCERWAAR